MYSPHTSHPIRSCIAPPLPPLTHVYSSDPSAHNIERQSPILPPICFATANYPKGALASPVEQVTPRLRPESHNDSYFSFTTARTYASPVSHTPHAQPDTNCNTATLSPSFDASVSSLSCRSSSINQILSRDEENGLEQTRIKRQRRGENGTRDRESDDDDASSSCNECRERRNSGNNSDTGSVLSDPLPQQQILRQSKGLRHFSKQVCDKVELKGVTTYNEVADELAEDFATQVLEHGGAKVDQKNIRRRVYDALNVLMAMGIIQKDKKEIRWLGLPGERDDGSSPSPSATMREELERQRSELRELERENKRLTREVRSKKNVVHDRFRRRLQLRNLIKRNSERLSWRTSDNFKYEKPYLTLPFVLVRCSRSSSIDIQKSSDGESILSFSPHEPKIIKDSDILDRLGMDKFSAGDLQQWNDAEFIRCLVDFQG
ncbi:9354_t:CDS:2 [Paraglomus occultum]|uniref:9354_t:CDS:1 n=1 Tax=Paraglomus occultum TaxID=144539 RepID=A0A9N8ZMT1_9GLOM|nr:9354_t:CDS:2 [Paraglomus occultum]